jgi:hypothetical protein
MSFGIGQHALSVAAADRREAPDWVSAPERGFDRLLGARAERDRECHASAQDAFALLGVVGVLVSLVLRLQRALFALVCSVYAVVRGKRIL